MLSLKLCAFAVLSIMLYMSAPALAGVLRTDATTNLPTDQLIDAAQAQDHTTESELAESTTIEGFVVEDASIKIGSASLDPAPGTLEGIEITLDTIEGKAAKTERNEDNKNLNTEEPKSSEEETKENSAETNKNDTAHSRDEAASIKVNAHESDDLAKEVAQSSVELLHEPRQSSKLLLLSTPRLAREQEENIEEPEDVDLNTAVSTDETTELSVEVDTETPKPSETEDNKPGFITRVRDAIFGKKSEEATSEATTSKRDEFEKASVDKEKQAKQNDHDTKKTDGIASPAAVVDAPAEYNNNAASAVLLETEPEYVIFDSDVVAHHEHLGSFTHIDSDEHLQPIVHSVEEVPTHFEEPLLFTSSYSHAW